METSFLRLSPLVIEGIGETWAARLAAAGITTIADLLRAGPEGLRHHVPGLRLASARAWVEAAQLFQVEGVDPDIAEALVRGGTGSVRELADASLRTVERALKTAHAERRLREVPSIYAMATLQVGAARLVDTGMIAGRVLDAATGAGMEGVEVRAGRQVATTDAEGAFHLISVRDGAQTLVGTLDGWTVFDAPIDVRAARLGPALAIRATRPDPSRYTPRREIDGAYVVPTAGSRLRIVTRPLEDVPDGAHLVVQEIGRTGRARLINLYRTRVGPMVLVDRVYAEAAQLPAGTRVKSVVRWSEGALRPTELSSLDVALRKFARAVPVGHRAAVAARAAAGDEAAPKVWLWTCEDDACDECESKQGHHVQQEAPTSHDGCRCSIREVDFGCETDVENVQFDESEHSILSVHEVENCDSDSPLPVHHSADPDPDEEWDDRLKEAAEQAGWTPPVAGELDADFEVPAGKEAEYSIGAKRVTQRISGALVLECVADGEHIRVVLDELHGTYVATTELLIENYALEDCKIQADPPPLP